MIELMLQAERALSMGLVDQAEHLYWQAVESDGRNVIAIVGLAKVALARGDDRTAMQFARKALQLDPEDGAATRLVERLEDIARLRTESTPASVDPPPALVPPAASAVPEAPEASWVVGPKLAPEESRRDTDKETAPGSTSSDDVLPTTEAAAVPGFPDAPAKPAPVTKPNRADIEWPSTDVLGAAPSALPRSAIPDRTITRSTTGSPPTIGSPPPEPKWPATLPPAAPRTEAAKTASPQTPAPTPAKADRAPTDAEKKRGLMGRFRRSS